MLNNPFTKQPTEKGELHCSGLSDIVGEDKLYSVSLSDSQYFGKSPCCQPDFYHSAKQLFVKAYQISLIHLENIY